MPAESKPLGSLKQPLEERLAQYPELKAKIESLLSVVEKADGSLNQANAAEQTVIEETRALGQAALTGWAEASHGSARDSFVQTHPKAHRNGEKTLLVQPIRPH